MAINETIKEVASEAGKSFVSYLLESLEPYTWVLKTILFIVVIIVIFKIYKSITKLQDHYRLIRIEEKLDTLLAKKENKNKKKKI